MAVETVREKDTALIKKKGMRKPGAWIVEGGVRRARRGASGREQIWKIQTSRTYGDCEKEMPKKRIEWNWGNKAHLRAL